MRAGLGKIVVAGAALLLGAPQARAGSNTVYNFLRNDVGARAAAMAGSFVTMTNDPTAFFYNPASGATMDAPGGSLGFFKHILDINAGHLVYSQHVEDLGYISGGILFTQYGSFTETDERGSALGTFSAADLALSVGYSDSPLENLYYGVTAKFVYSGIGSYSSTALAADAGILYTIPESRLALGASLRNLGGQMSSYAGVGESLPLDLTVGASVVPRGLPLHLHLNFHRLTDDAESFGDRLRWFTIGGEFTLSTALQLRLGYDNGRRQDLKIGSSAGLAGFSIGLGLTVSDYHIDYALSSLGAIGNLHRISVAARL
jgi:hypothetical protein